MRRGGCKGSWHAHACKCVRLCVQFVFNVCVHALCACIAYMHEEYALIACVSTLADAQTCPTDVLIHVSLHVPLRVSFVCAQKGRSVLYVVPTLKEIDSPRDLEALSPREIRRQVESYSTPY